MKYIPLFLLIQLVSAVLTLVGIPICAYLAWTDPGILTGTDAKWHWPAWAWIWDNDEDGTMPVWYANAHPKWSFQRLEFTWTALRNPCNNLRYVRGVSKVGRPLFYKTWIVPVGTLFLSGREFYVKAGWLSNGFPCLSGGSGRGY